MSSKARPSWRMLRIPGLLLACFIAGLIGGRLSDLSFLLNGLQTIATVAASLVAALALWRNSEQLKVARVAEAERLEATANLVKMKVRRSVTSWYNHNTQRREWTMHYTFNVMNGSASSISSLSPFVKSSVGGMQDVRSCPVLYPHAEVGASAQDEKAPTISMVTQTFGFPDSDHPPKVRFLLLNNTDFNVSMQGGQGFVGTELDEAKSEYLLYRANMDKCGLFFDLDGKSWVLGEGGSVTPVGAVKATGAA